MRPPDGDPTVHATSPGVDQGSAARLRLRDRGGSGAHRGTQSVEEAREMDRRHEAAPLGALHARACSWAST
jgi:hypothetical protein